ncbi:MAG: DUF3267 domain-containing protein [Verrucomicrobia bacterium]|nr:DUF3267 domain-containing protein [Verrucomicrobiota bacterium]
MRFHVGPIPGDPRFQPEREGWRPLREPTPWAMQFLATPVGIGVAFLLGWLWVAAGVSADLGARTSALVQGGPFTVLALLPGFFALIVVHEFIHAFAQPGSGLSRDAVIGFWPRKLLFYAHYLGPLSRGRFLFIFAAPFLALSVLPLAVQACCGGVPGWVALVSIINGLASCGDAVGFALVVFQVPRRACVRNQDWRTWWKPADAPSEPAV